MRLTCAPDKGARLEFFSFLKKRKGRRAARGAPQLPPGTQVPAAEAPPAGEGPPPPLTPEQVRQRLFDAVAAGNEDHLDALCHEHQAVILQHGEGWLTVPPQFQASPQIQEWYRRGLDAIARYCAEKLRRNEYIAQLGASEAQAEPERANAP